MGLGSGLGGWVDGEAEGKKAVGMRCCELGGWVGGWDVPVVGGTKESETEDALLLLFLLLLFFLLLLDPSSSSSFSFAGGFVEEEEVFSIGVDTLQTLI